MAIAVLSPAKTLDYESERDLPPATRPRFAAETAELVAHAKTLSVADLSRLMSISDDLARLNHDRYQRFADLPERPAVQAFDGDVYTGLDAKTLDGDAILFAQTHLRILSGLFGMLRPLDLMKPYRLEMGTKRFPAENKLSIWWQDRIARVLADDARESGEAAVLNLASQEYWASCKGRMPSDVRIVDVEFLAPDGRMITMHAKLARGHMARWMIENRVTAIDDMRAFNAEGYAFDAEASVGDRWIFRRSA